MLTLSRTKSKSLYTFTFKLNTDKPKHKLIMVKMTAIYILEIPISGYFY